MECSGNRGEHDGGAAAEHDSSRSARAYEELLDLSSEPVLLEIQAFHGNARGRPRVGHARQARDQPVDVAPRTIVHRRDRLLGETGALRDRRRDRAVEKLDA